MKIEVPLLGVELLFPPSAFPLCPLMSSFSVFSHNVLKNYAYMGLLWILWVG